VRGRTGLAAGLAAAVLVTANCAHAQFFDSVFGPPRYGNPYGGSPYGYGRPREVAPPALAPHYRKPRPKPVEAAKKEPAVKPLAGPLLISISINRQRLTLYSDGAPVSHAPVSTGVPGHPTPLGIFSVIGKERFHRSNLYSNAPMPWMQRITWSGVAMHEGVLPGYPASHGCIRLPGSFAQYLFATTKMGVRVVITRDETAPFEIAHAKLFAPRPKSDDEPIEQVHANADGEAKPVRVAETEVAATTTDALKAAQAAAGTEPAPAMPQLKGSLDRPDAPSRRKTVAAAELSDVVDTQAPSPTAIDATVPGEPVGNAIKRGRASTAELKEKPKMSEPVSVFISRKTGKLYVRQGFEPLFETPVTIRDADVPLGTHVFTAMNFSEDGSAVRWVAMTLANQPASEPVHPLNHPLKKQKKASKEELEAPVVVPTSSRVAAARALDRIEIPQETVDRISDLLSPGSSLIVSDYPVSGETGKYTDFIILTR